MQVVILCGGTGTRLRELTELTPKPLIPIGGKPMIWHIMKIYMHYGFHDFILPLGYKQEAFKLYFNNFDIINNDITINNDPFNDRRIESHSFIDDYSVTLIDTGVETLKGARLKKIEQYVKEDIFMVTYGDGLADINIEDLLSFHVSHGRIATVTGVTPRSKFGELTYQEDGRVTRIIEKPKMNGKLTNGGFMVFNKKLFNYLWLGKDCDLEVGPLEQLAINGELYVYGHDGFWKNADTLKDIGELQELWDSNEPPWLVWE